DDVERRAVIVDGSESVDGAALVAARAAARRLVSAAGPAALSVEVGAAAEGPPPDGVERARIVADSAGGSPLGRALATALRSFPRDARGSITLFSDGLATDPHAAPAIEAAAERGIPVHVVPLASTTAPVTVTGLRTRGTLVAGQSARIVVECVGDAPEVEVALETEAGPAGSRTVAVAAGRAAVELGFEPPRGGFLALTATARPTGAGSVDGARARATRTFPVQDPLRVLHLGGRTAASGERLAEAIGGGFEVVSGVAASEEGVGRLDRFDVVVIDDLPAEELPESFQRSLAEAVERDGVGLFACGGRAAFGPGGWADTTLAELLPVEARQKEEKRDPSTTLVVIIDTSGSMGGNRVQLAKEVARLAIRRLLPHDKVGIVEFYGAKRWAAPIQPASNAIDIQRALNRLDAGGGTVILPAIEEAFYGLQNVRTRYKHVLILTDGGVERGAFEPLLRKMADEGMNVSTVLIGPDAHSEFLVSLAQWGKGRFYSVPNRFNLPEILLKQPTSARLPAYRPGVHPIRARAFASFLGDVDVHAAPPLAGYVETSARPAATRVLETVESAHPILATWPVGAGVVTALTTEPTGEGTGPWREWSDAGRLLARALARTAAGKARPFAVRATRADHEVIVTARRTGRGEERPTLAWLDGPRAAPGFEERAAGRFEVRFVADPDRDVRLEVAVEGDPAAPSTRAFVARRGDVRDELRVDPADRLDLTRLAAVTGGTVVPLRDAAGFDPPAGGGPGALRLIELRPLLALLALLVWMGELLYRRRPRAGGGT
ncbi:MAG: VWA domain-containing protein, partial [Planctomycetota bacterium JB042]